ncbi:MAG: hypothetical protein L6Q35_09935 [Phycisphaerales bacterium]|nr:hypothetical protein [Phycisphaerales bacterium]
MASWRHGILVGVFVALFVAAPATGQTSDPITSAIENARGVFERAIDQERQKLLDALTRAEADPAIDGAARERIAAERRLFEEDSSLPPVSLPRESETYQREIKRAYAVLSANWSGKAAALRKASRDDEAAALEEELSGLREENPLLSWTDLICTTRLDEGASSGWSVEDRELVSTGTLPGVVRFSPPPGQEFELELDVARTVDDAEHGPLAVAFNGSQRGVLVIGGGEEGRSIELRDAPGGAATAEITAPASGKLAARVVLSVRKSGVHVSVDGETVIDWSPSSGQLKLPADVSSEMNGSRLAILGEGPGFRVSSLTHRVLEPEPRQAVATAGRRQKSTPATSSQPIDPWATGTRFSGSFDHTRPSSSRGSAEVSVVSRGADTVTLKIVTNRTWTIEFNVNGRSIHGSSENPNPNSRGRIRISDLAVSGELDGDRLRLTYVGKARTIRPNKKDGKSQNNEYRGTIVVTRQ